MPILTPKQLVLVTRHDPRIMNDMHAIAVEMTRLAPHVKVALASHADTAATLGIGWDRPTVTVGFGVDLGRLAPLRGAVFQNRPIGKVDQYMRFRAAGIAAPRTGELRPGQRFSSEGWSDFVVVKPLPLSLTSKGSSAHLFRASALARLDPAALPRDHMLRTTPVLVQDFVDTGLHPSKWRVLTLFGDPLYASFSRSVLPRADLDAPDAEIEASAIEPRTEANVQADTDGARDRLIADPEVLEFARRIHEIFPRVPLLGIDILRREGDGTLFALEVNAGGNVWHFSSYAEKHRARLGGKQAMIDQFGAWRVAARALIRIVERNAC